jgi:hypothetical protein
MSGLPPFATELQTSLEVRFVPTAEFRLHFTSYLPQRPTVRKNALRNIGQAGTRRVHLALVHEGVQNKGGSAGACRKYPEPSYVSVGLLLHLLLLLLKIVSPFLRWRDIKPNQRGNCLDLFPQPVEARHQYGVHDDSHENEPGRLVHTVALIW